MMCLIFQYLHPVMTNMCSSAKNVIFGPFSVAEFVTMSNRRRVASIGDYHVHVRKYFGGCATDYYGVVAIRATILQLNMAAKWRYSQAKFPTIILCSLKLFQYKLFLQNQNWR